MLSVAFSRDDQYIISGSKDRSVQFWDLRLHHSQLLLQVPTFFFLFVSFPACNRLLNLAVFGRDTAIRLFQLQFRRQAIISPRVQAIYMRGCGVIRRPRHRTSRTHTDTNNTHCCFVTRRQFCVVVLFPLCLVLRFQNLMFLGLLLRRFVIKYLYS